MRVGNTAQRDPHHFKVACDMTLNTLVSINLSNVSFVQRK